MSTAARHLVSQKKFRTLDKNVPDGGVDLDLTEIHPRIVCMGYPATGFESLYRNSYNDALRYLDYKYGDHYVVYNLCKEKKYQYGSDKFHGRVRVFPFFDHAAAPLALMCAFVEDAVTYLSEDEKNVVVIHCKAGKGRTGIMSCCLLLVLEPSLNQSADAVIKFYGEQRVSNGKGLTVPSQRRSVMYYERLLKAYNGNVPDSLPTLALNEIRLVGFLECIAVSTIEVCVNEAERPLVIKTKKDNALSVSVSTIHRELSDGSKTKVTVIDCSKETALQAVCGDVKLSLLDGSEEIGILSFSTLFVVHVYYSQDIDKLCKNRRAELCSVELDYQLLI